MCSQPAPSSLALVSVFCAKCFFFVEGGSLLPSVGRFPPEVPLVLSVGRSPVGTMGAFSVEVASVVGYSGWPRDPPIDALFIRRRSMPIRTEERQ
ncbi:hypothetical protein BHE74_00038552, partial [Ensete ventricosum]